MIQFDAGVRIGFFNDRLGEIFQHASVWSLATNKPVVVFSVQDKTHGATSLHPFGLAVDLDVLGNVDADLRALYAWMRVHMPSGYDVIFEGNHIHVEYDTKRSDSSSITAVNSKV